MSEFSLETTTLGDVRELLSEAPDEKKPVNNFQKRLQDLREEFKEHGKIYLSLDEQNRLIVIGKQNYKNNDIIKIKKSVGQVDFFVAAVCGEAASVKSKSCKKYTSLAGFGDEGSCSSTMRRNALDFYKGNNNVKNNVKYNEIEEKFEYICDEETTLGELRTCILSNDANGLQLDEDQKKILLYIGKRLFEED
jgi:hypothetical protein